MKRLFQFRQKSLARQILLGLGVSLATVGASTLWVHYSLVKTDLSNQVKRRAESITQSLEFAVEGVLEVENRSILRRVVQNYATLPAVVEIAIIDPQGKALAHSSQDLKNRPYKSLHPELAATLDQATQSGLDQTLAFVLNGKSVLAAVLPFRSPLFGTSGNRGLVVAIVDLQQMETETGNTVLASSAALLAGLVAILVLMGLLMRRWVLRPLAELNQAVALSKQSGTFVLPTRLPDNEILFLAKTFDKVLRQLEAYDQLKVEIAQRQQVEAILREREASERQKATELEHTLQELRQAQTQLIQSEKMSSLGQLVAGVAHEINNPVNFIHGNLHHTQQYAQDLLDLVALYQEHYPNPNPDIVDKADDIDLDFLRQDVPRMLHSMQVGADRIREIVQSLRTFSRLDEAEIKAVDIHDGIDSTLMILQNRLKAKSDHPGIQIIKQYAALPQVECYAGQLNQVFMNILSNAIDALEDHPEPPSPEVTAEKFLGTITIATLQVSPESVAIHITDDGPGMPESVQKRLFDPFFTTKVVGKGTGLGMSISHQIITEKHRGHLYCKSEPGAGTTFVIEIPIKMPKG